MRSAVRAAARRRRVGWVNGTSRSVVEDRLVHVERLVEPPEAVASPDPLEDRPGQIGARNSSRRIWAWTLGTRGWVSCASTRSEEHTSELQSLTNLVCRLLLEKKKTTKT